MLPHMFISSSKAVPVYGLTDELLSDYKKGRHLKTSKNFDIDYCHKLIDYFKHCLALYTDWDCFNFKFSDTESYNDIGEFYKEVTEQGYYMNWTYIGSDDIDSLQENGQLYLFQIYNKDFSEKSFGNQVSTLLFYAVYSVMKMLQILLSSYAAAQKHSSGQRA